MEFNIEDSWKNELKKEFEKPYFKTLQEFVEKEYKNGICYPPENKIFEAFYKTSFQNTKVVILGQDPYHGYKQANGLAFSVSQEVRIPPSLRNIFKEIQNEFEGITPIFGDLEFWAEQGVLLLNSTLTVRENDAASHQKQGWETFTDFVISTLSIRKDNLVFMLWGNYAKSKVKLIDISKHQILTAVHPSPLSAHRGFFGCNHFLLCNEYLLSHGNKEISWLLPT